MRGAEQTVLFCYFNSPLGMISNFGTLLKAEGGRRRAEGGIKKSEVGSRNYSIMQIFK